MRQNALTPKATHEDSDFMACVRFGLRQQPKSIPPKFFYDAHGAHLFDLICSTSEYYLTRTETSILERYGSEMAELIGPSCVLIELGSGSATKTPLLLQHLARNTVYVPIDICEPNLRESTQRLQVMFPSMSMRPVCMDYNKINSYVVLNEFTQRRVIFFPGSTIGNYTSEEAVHLLNLAAKIAGKDGALLIGVDNKKSPELLNAAYNDSEGYTAAFNLNLLARMQQELGAELDEGMFAHLAFYNVNLGRIEMHLVSQCEQDINLGMESFHFIKGETIHTENSYKYTTYDFQQLAHAAGWYINGAWSDHDQLFNVYYLNRVSW